MKILLHCCCGPCAIMCITMLREAGHEVTAYWANPNIHPLEEYLARREAFVQITQKMDIPVIWQDDAYSMSGWLKAVHTLDITDNNNGDRCRYCYATRLSLTAATAAERGFGAFSTSLLYSIYQKHDIILEEGHKAEDLVGNTASFLGMDFRPGWRQGQETAKEWGVYRQKYCACIFSEEERFGKKIRRLVEQQQQ